MDMDAYWTKVMVYRTKHPKQREGQILFNVFAGLYPDMANFACGKPFDPFYDDDRIPLFIEFISRLP